MSNTKSGRIIILLLGIVILLLFYSKVFFNPNQYLFSSSGDAIKNYYTYAYHIKNDTSYIHFDGMNYPYGEHYLYTDCHPLLANIMKSISNVFPSINNNIIGILNFIMIISILLTFLVIYQLLKFFNIDTWHSIIGSIVITIMAPQIFRLTGHFALSYSFFIPLSIYLTIKIHNANNNKTLVKWTLIALVANIICFFTHAYLGIMLVFYQMCFWLISQLYIKKSLVSRIKTLIPYTIFAILPVIIFRVYLFYTDTHIGRTDNPSGFFLQNAEIDDILIPHHPPLHTFLTKTLHLKVDLNWEAWSYIGFATVLSLLIIIIKWVRKKIKKSKTTLISPSKKRSELQIILIASLILLVFAFGIPFKQFPILLDWLPAVKQFRATGRFTWFSYYALTLFVFIILVNYSSKFEKKGNLIWGKIIILTYSTFMIIEGAAYHKAVSKSITRSKNLFVEANLDEEFKQTLKNIDFQEYQAILPLPFYHYGSESFARPRKPKVVQSSMILSYHTNLPLMSSNLTRVSIPESKKIIQMLCPNFYSKEIENELDTKKPILIIKSNEPLSSYEKKILNKATMIYKGENFHLLKLPPQKLFISENDEVYKEYKEQERNLTQKNGFKISDSTGYVYYNSFEHSPSEITFRGKGAYTGVKKGKNVFATIASNTFEKNKSYHLSLWMYNGYKDALNLWFRLIIEEIDQKGKRVNRTIVFPEESEVINGNWSLVEMTFFIKDPKNEIKIYSKGKSNSKAKLLADDLLIKNSKNDIYKYYFEENTGNNVLFKNNHKIVLEKKQINE